MTALQTVRFHRDGTEMVVTALPADGLSVVFEAHKFFQDCTAVIVMNGPSFDAQPDNPWSEVSGCSVPACALCA